MKTRSKSQLKAQDAKPVDVLAQLYGGDRRSIGRSNRVATLVLHRPQLFPAPMRGLWQEDRLVRMRAADTAEKVSRERPEWLKPFKRELLGLMAETEEQELRWHLSLMIPRLAMTAPERRRAIALLRSYLSDRSSIVKTFAMQALTDIAEGDAELRSETIEMLRGLTGSGTPAMRARGRKLLARLGDL